MTLTFDSKVAEGQSSTRGVRLRVRDSSIPSEPVLCDVRVRGHREIVEFCSYMDKVTLIVALQLTLDQWKMRSALDG